jgi:hypothetical protein
MRRQTAIILAVLGLCGCGKSDAPPAKAEAAAAAEGDAKAAYSEYRRLILESRKDGDAAIRVADAADAYSNQLIESGIDPTKPGPGRDEWKRRQAEADPIWKRAQEKADRAKTIADKWKDKWARLGLAYPLD